jgi:hypothetical protein
MLTDRTGRFKRSLMNSRTAAELLYSAKNGLVLVRESTSGGRSSKPAYKVEKRVYPSP